MIFCRWSDSLKCTEASVRICRGVRRMFGEGSSDGKCPFPLHRSAWHQEQHKSFASSYPGTEQQSRVKSVGSSRSSAGRGIRERCWTGRQMSWAAELLQSPSELPGCSLHSGLSRAVKSLLLQLSWKSLHTHFQSVHQLLCISRAWDHLASALRSKQAGSSSSLKELVG